MGKSGPNATLDLFFHGFGWPWVGEFDGFMIIFICFPTQPNLVYCKHPSVLRLDLDKSGRSSTLTPHYIFIPRNFPGPVVFYDTASTKWLIVHTNSSLHLHSEKFPRASSVLRHSFNKMVDSPTNSSLHLHSEKFPRASSAHDLAQLRLNGW